MEMKGKWLGWAWFLILGAFALAMGLVLFLPDIEEPVRPPDPAEVSADARHLEPLAPVAPVGLSRSRPSERVPEAGDWEERLEDILALEATDRVVLDRLLGNLPRLPVEAQEEFISHALNLCEDEDYGKVEAVYFAAGTPPEVSEEIFNDLLNRPDEIKLPALAKTLRNPAHPMAGEAREILEMYLDLDEGAAPPAGWEAAVRQYLVEERED
jgi:hypothetical protein